MSVAVPTQDELINILYNDPDSLKSLFPEGHPDLRTIEIAKKWLGCAGCIDQIARLLHKSLRSLQ